MVTLEWARLFPKMQVVCAGEAGFVAGVTRFFHRLWVIVAAVRDCPGVVFEVFGATPLPYSLLGSAPGPRARFVRIVLAPPRLRP